LWASSARLISAQAEPSEQSNTPSRPATASAPTAIRSFGTSLRNCARGFSAPLARFFHATCVIASRIACGSTSYLLQYAGSSRLNAAGAVSAISGAVPSLGALERTSPE
jgi:hypothetical protein